MKTMTCKQLGGACDKEFHAETFEGIAEMGNNHGMQMHKKGDGMHLKAMENMKGLMQDPKAMKGWMESKRKEFDALPEDE